MPKSSSSPSESAITIVSIAEAAARDVEGPADRDENGSIICFIFEWNCPGGAKADPRPPHLLKCKVVDDEERDRKTKEVQ